MKIQSLLISGLFSLSLVSCSSFSGTSNADKTVLQSGRNEVTATAENTVQQTSGDHQESMSPLKILNQAYGTYEGTLPCDDCEGMIVMILLNDNYLYQLDGKYIGKDERFPGTVGSYSFDENSYVITLQNLRGIPDNYLLKNETLVLLDENGQERTDAQSSPYVLRKID